MLLTVKFCIKDFYPECDVSSLDKDTRSCIMEQIFCMVYTHELGMPNNLIKNAIQNKLTTAVKKLYHVSMSVIQKLMFESSIEDMQSMQDQITAEMLEEEK